MQSFIIYADLRKRRRNVRKKSKFPLPLIVALCLALCLSSLGITYAAWNDNLRINSVMNTGTMEVLFHQDQRQFYRIGIYDANQQAPMLIAGKESITVELEDKNQLAKITITDFMSNETLEKLVLPNHMLVLQYPLDLGPNSTVNKVELIKADFEMPCKEEDKVEFKASKFSLLVNDSEFNLPGLIMDEYSIPLKFDVYRQIEAQGDQLLATIYLRLTNGNDLKELTQDFTLDQADLGSQDLLEYVNAQGTGEIGFSAMVKVQYEAVVPVLVEQGHSKSWEFKEDNIQFGFSENWVVGGDTIKLRTDENSLSEQGPLDSLPVVENTIEQDLIEQENIEEDFSESFSNQGDILEQESSPNNGEE